MEVAVVVEAGEAVGDGLDLGPAEADGGRLQHRRQGVGAVGLLRSSSSDSTTGASTVTAATTCAVAVTYRRDARYPDAEVVGVQDVGQSTSPASTRASSSSASQGSPQCETSSSVSPVSSTVMHWSPSARRS